MAKINIGIEVDLEKMLDTRVLIQAGSGGGKSYLLRKLAESVGNKVQQIIIDPEGEFVTLREKFDFVLIGKDGDIPLSLKYAETLAHKLLETNLSAIIDLYELKHHDRILFVKRFLDALINSPKELWHSCLVYVDEAHMFCPESSKSESMSSVIDLCTRGRKRGFAAVLATQRLSKLHKDAAAECLNKMIGRTGLDIDRKRAGDELGFINKADMNKLRELTPGEFYGFGPAMSNEVIQFKVNPVITTHLQAGNRISVNPPTPNAVKKILNKLADIPQEAEKELQTKQDYIKEITRLRSQVTRLENEKPQDKSASPAIASLNSTITQLRSQNNQLERTIKDQALKIQEHTVFSGLLINWGNDLKTIAGKMPVKKPGLLKALPQPVSSGPSSDKIRPAAQQIRDNSAASIKPQTDGTKKLPVGERLILTACAQFPNGLERKQLTVLTGYKRSSRDAYIQRLGEKGLLEKSGDRLLPTNEGIEVLGDNFERLPTGDALQQYWLKELPKGEAMILEMLINHYPQAVERSVITDVTGYMRSSRDAYIQRMTAKEIVVISERGAIKASETLFD